MPWALPDGEPALLALAKSYPYDAPAASFHFVAGRSAPIETADYEDRVPVLAHGSNRAPVQLARKYGASAEIPVTVGWLSDHDVVFSAHVTQYGAIASTLQHAPATRVRVSVTWLSPAQLDRMHETEGPSNYAYGRLREVSLALEAGPAAAITEAFVYVGRHGCLGLDGMPVGLAAIPAERRPHRALHQEQVLTHVRDRHRPGSDLDRMILGAIRDPAVRRALVADLRAEAVAPVMPHFEPVAD